MSRGGPSLTALLGLLAIAGYQNRDKISEWLGSGSGGGAGAASGDRPSGLDKLLPSGGGGGLGTMLRDGLGDLVDRFTQNGHGDTANSWVGPGQNRQIAAPDLETALGSDTISELQQKTGLSRDEILSRLSRELPNAVDRYTPDGRLPSPA